MTEVRPVNSVNGSLFDVARLKELAGDNCNLLAVSDRTLYSLERFARNEVNWLSRYVESYVGENDYVPVDLSSPDVDFVQNVARLFRLEVSDMSCDLVAAINSLTVVVQGLSQVGCDNCGSQIDPPGASVPPIGPGEDFPTIDAFETYKCRGANWLSDGVEDVFAKLQEYDVGFWASTTVALASSLVAAILTTTLIGGPFTLVAGAVIAFVTALIVGATISLADIETALIANRADLICALFNGTDADGSKTNYEAELVTAGLNVAEVALVMILLNSEVMNNLYEFNATVNSHPITTSCDGCGPEPCPFDVVFGTGTPTYDTQPFVMSSVPNGGFNEINLQSPASGTGCSAANWCVEFTATTITQPEGTFQRRLWCWKDAVSFFDVAFPGMFPALDTPYTVASQQFISASPFTVTMKVTSKVGFCVSSPAEGCS